MDRFVQPVEEYELQYIDGDNHRLFDALGISQATLAAWFTLLEALDEDEDRYLIACCLAEEEPAIGKSLKTDRIFC